MSGKLTAVITCLVVLVSGANGFAAVDSLDVAHCYYTCKVWGCLKYFHPAVGNKEVNWDQALLDVLERLDADGGQACLDSTLMPLFRAAGPVPKDQPGQEHPANFNLNRDLQWFDSPDLSTNIRERLVELMTEFRPFISQWVGTPSFGKLGFIGDKAFYDCSPYDCPSRSVRLLALFRFWNAVNYFFPYKNIMDVSWDRTLREMIPVFVADQSYLDYHKNCLRLVKRICDSHGMVISEVVTNEIYGRYFMPVDVRHVENQFVITRVLHGACPLQPGDVILALDGNPVSARQDLLRTLIASSNDAWLYNRIARFLLRGDYGKVKVTVKREGGETVVEVKRYYSSSEMSILREQAASGPAWKMLTYGNEMLGYVDGELLVTDDIPAMVADLWQSDGFITDLRNYPDNIIWSLMGYIVDRMTEVALFAKPSGKSAGMFNWESSYMAYGDFNNVYPNPLYILHDGSSISHSEYTIMALMQHPRAVNIGSQTAGADGDVAYLYLPHGVHTIFTGMGVYFPDTTQTQRIGMIPDIEVHPTIAGIRAGRDEVLEAAIAHHVRTAVHEADAGPDDFELMGSYPNPFNGSTVIELNLKQAEEAELAIFDVNGRKLATLHNGLLSPGRHRMVWDARDDHGQPVASGLYLGRLTGGGMDKTVKMILIK